MAGNRSPSVVNRAFLLKRIRSCRHNCPTVDDIVDHLQSTYRDYRGLKRLPFSSIVQRTLESLEISRPKMKKSNKSPLSTSIKRQIVDLEDQDADRGCESTSQKKRCKRVDLSEQRLQSMEDIHLKRIQQSDRDDSSSMSSSDKSGDGAVSMSEDAVYGEFDFMNSMLRASYTESNKAKSEHLEKSLELDIAIENDKAAKRIDVGNEANVSKGALDREGQSCVSNGPRFNDLAGMQGVLKELKNKVIVPFYHPQLPRYLGVRPISGILFHGPPGCGKTTLAHAIANETGVPFYSISGTEFVSGVSGASEESIRELFSKAYRTAPSIVFIDEIDAIASKRENLQREMERRIVTQLMTCMDSFHKHVNSANAPILVIGATNRPDVIDPALRRPGRFDKEFKLGVPDEKARVEILSTLTKTLRLEGSFDILKIARATPGFVGVDLTMLITEASNLALERVINQRERESSTDLVDDALVEDLWKRPWLPEDLEKVAITMNEFEEAIKVVQPSLKREGFSSIPNVRWEDVGGLERLRIEFDRHIVNHVKYPEDYEGIGMNLGTGILLYGPPGCGKTLVAQAVANEAGANFIHVKGPELLSKYVGESELAVRSLFSRARTCTPCIIFFDEMDAVTAKRDNESGRVVEQLLNQLLIELDGVEQRRGVFVIGATNRLEVIDRAVLRPGRLGNVVFVPVPGPNERGLILQALGRKMCIDVNVDLHAVGQQACENFSGADLAAMMKEAAMVALEEKHGASVDSNLNSAPCTIKMTHIEQGLAKISPSVSKKRQQRFYQIFSKWKQGAC